MVAENVKNIDLILNAHDHKDYTTLTGKTQIVSHGQNSQFVRGINMMFDDNGKLIRIKSEKFHTFPHIKAARKDPAIAKFTTKLLKKDLIPLAYIDKNENEPAELMYNNDIRYKNSVLANYITSGIKSAAQKTYPDLDLVGIPSTIIRSGILSNSLRSTFNNIDLINMFQGVDTNVSGLRIGAIKGRDLLDLISENVRNNLKSPTRNALIQWSDIQIDRSYLEEHISDKNCHYEHAIKIRNPKSKMFEYITPEQKYNVLLADKYLVKNSEHIKVPSKIKRKFKPIPESYPQLFKEFLESEKGEVKIKDEIKEGRIV